MVHDFIFPQIVLFFRWEVAVDEEIRRLQKVGLLGQLLDRIAPMHQESLVAVDEGDFRADGRGVEVRRIEYADPVGRVIRVNPIFADRSGSFERFESGRGDGVVGYGDCDGLASAVVGHRYRVVALWGTVCMRLAGYSTRFFFRSGEAYGWEFKTAMTIPLEMQIRGKGICWK